MIKNKKKGLLSKAQSGQTLPIDENIKFCLKKCSLDL